jgi:hypothetical protein
MLDLLLGSIGFLALAGSFAIVISLAKENC